MPLVKWACPPHKDGTHDPLAKHGNLHDFAHCAFKCKDQCVSPPLIAALSHAEVSNHHTRKYVSATGLYGCSRKLKLERTEDYADYMRNKLYAMRGTVIHEVIDQASGFKFTQDGVTVSMEDMGWLSEYSMLFAYCFTHGGFAIPDSVNVHDESTWDKVACPHCRGAGEEGGFFLMGGTLDSLQPHWEEFDEGTGVLPCTLWDIKTLGDYALRLFILGDTQQTHHSHIRDSYFVQAHVYKYMLERVAVPTVLANKGVTRIVVKEAHIQGFGMNDFPASGRHYPFKTGRGRTAVTDSYFIPGISFYPDEWTEQYISKRGRVIYNSLVTGETRGEVCSPTSNNKGLQSWECDFCAFSHTEFCPNAKVEWAALQEGVGPEEAFMAATLAWESGV
jgi:hypothetical protein